MPVMLPGCKQQIENTQGGRWHLSGRAVPQGTLSRLTAIHLVPVEGVVKVPSPSGRGLGRGDQQGQAFDFRCPHPNLLPEGEGAATFCDTLRWDKVNRRQAREGPLEEREFTGQQ